MTFDFSRVITSFRMTASRMLCFCLLANLNLAYDPNYYLTFLKDVSVKMADIHSKGPNTVDSHLHCASLCYGYCLGYRYRPRDKFCITWERKQISKKKDFPPLSQINMNVGQFCGVPPIIGNSKSTYDGYHFGSVARYTCSDKYRFCGRRGRSECRSMGRWSGVKSQCMRHSWKNIKRSPEDNEEMKFPCGQTGKVRVEIVGKMTKRKEMNFRMMTKSDILFLLSVRYKNDGSHKKVIMNTRIAGHWGKNKVIKKFPFILNKVFHLSLSLRKGKYKVLVDKKKLSTFMERQKGQKPLKVRMGGSVKVISLSVY